MTAAPALAAAWADVLSCLGIGLLLAAARDMLGLLLGNGRVRCFVWDLVAFAAAAVLLCGFVAGASYSGVLRWYMAAGLGAGALGWRWAVSGSVHRLLRCAKRALLAPPRRLWRAWTRRRTRQTGKKTGKKSKNVTKKKKMLQTHREILYN